MAALPTSAISVTGGAPTYTNCASGGDTVPGQVVATGRCKAMFHNSSAGALTVTMVDPTLTAGGLATTDPTYVVAAAVAGAPGENELAIPVAMIDPATGNVAFTYSANPPTGLSVAVRTV